MGNDHDCRTDKGAGRSKALTGRARRWAGRIRSRRKPLEDSWESYRHLSENIPCAAYSALPHKDTPPLFISSKIEEITGYPAKAFQRDPSLKFKIVHPKDLDRVRHALEDSRKNKVPLDIEYRIFTRNGQERWVRDKDSPVLNSEGEIMRINGFMEDITARVRMEEALIQSEERYRDLVENAGEIIIVLQDERIRYFNRKAMESTGYTRDEIYFTPFEKFVHPDDMEQIVSRYAARMKGKQLEERFQFRIRKKDGRYLWAEVGSRLIEWEGKPAILDFITDISERKTALDRQQDYLRTLSAILNASPDAALLFEPDGRILAANEATAGMAGVNMENLIGKIGYEIIPADLAQIRKEKIDTCARTGKPVRFEDSFKDRIYASSLYPVFDEAGSVIRIAAFTSDITQKRLDEKQRSDMEHRLRQTRKFESLGVMAGGIAHDFNNLLTAILGNLELAEMKAGPSSSIMDTLQQAEKAAVKAADLTRQILTYTGKGRFNIIPVDLTTLIEEMGPVIASFVSGAACARKELDSATPFIMADPSQIKQVVISLVTNAAESIGERAGEIRIRTGTTKCDGEYLGKSHIHADLAPGMYVYLDVQDDGEGMDQYTIERLFDPFFTTKFPGRGLGMPAVHGIVRSHGGAIMVDSTKGQGTTIRLLFPVYEPGNSSHCPER